MPLGDSITRGGGWSDQEPYFPLPYPTYRYYLFSYLTEAGKIVDYVGPYNGVGADFEFDKWDPDTYAVPDAYQEPGYPSFPDQDMSGSTGWKIDRFLENGTLPADQLIHDFNPDCVLVHLGTNNMGSGDDTPEMTITKMGPTTLTSYV